MTGHRRSRRRRVLPGLLLLAVGLALAVPVVAAPGAAAESTVSPPTVEVVRQSSFVGDNEDFLLELRVTNAASTDTRVTVRQHDRALSHAALRSGQLGRSADTRNFDWRALTDPRTSITTLAVPPVSSVAGVYPVEITVGKTTVRTNLVRLPSTTSTTTTGSPGATTGPAHPALLVSLVVPLSSPPVRQPSLTDGGAVRLAEPDRARLTTLVSTIDANATVPLTLVPSPELVENLPFSTERADRELLVDLQNAVAGREVVAGPYVTIDAEAWRAAGMGDPYRSQRADGARALHEVLDVDPTTDVALVDPGTTASTLALLRDVGVSSVVASEDALEPLDARAYPAPVSQRFALPVEGGPPMRAVAADAYLRDIVESAGDPVVDANRVLADLAMSWLDQSVRPSDVRRGIVLTTPDEWSPTKPFLSALLQGLTQAPGVLEPVTLSTFVSRVSGASPVDQRSGTETLVSGPLVRAPRPAAPVSLGDYPARRAQIAASVASYRSMVDVVTATDVAVDEMLRVSADRRLTAGQRDEYLGVAERWVAGVSAGAVRTPARQRVTIAGRQATIAFTVENRTTQPLKVRIQLVSDSRVEFPDTGRSFEQTLAPGSNRVQIRVRARATGETPVRVLVTPPLGGLDTLAEGQLIVRSAALSGIGLALSVVALAVLVSWWVRHGVRTRRARGATVPSAEPGSPAGADATACDAPVLELPPPDPLPAARPAPTDEPVPTSEQA